jgi:dienelactone hydrolase
MAEPDLTYTVQPYMRDRFDKVGRELRFAGATPEEVRAWQRRAWRKLGQIIGLHTMQHCPLRPKVTERVDCGDHIRERVELQVEPKIIMPVYVLIPKAGEPPYPVMLNPHGHGGGGKAAVAGVRDVKEIAKAIGPYNYDYGVAFCRAGFVSLCPDARGFGERQEVCARENVLDSSCVFINRMAMPLGQTVTGMWVWDLQRLIDYAAMRPDCNVNRLGCAGLSGGGLQTLWATLFDRRIKAAVVSGYFYGVKQSLLDLHGNCSCNYVPRLWEYADHGDLGGLIAPRPLMIQTGDEDNLNGAGGLKNVRSQVSLARKVYKAANAAKNLKHDVFHGPHRWDSTNAVPFMQKQLQTS